MKINKKLCAFLKSTFLILILLLVHQNILAEADLEIKDNEGNTVLDLAFKRLATTEDEATDQNIPYLTVEKGQPNLVNIIKILFEKGAPLGNKNKSKASVEKYLAVEENEGRLKGWLGEEKYNELLDKVGIEEVAATTGPPTTPATVSEEDEFKKLKTQTINKLTTEFPNKLDSLLDTDGITFDNDFFDEDNTFLKTKKLSEIITKLNEITPENKLKTQTINKLTTEFPNKLDSLLDTDGITFDNDFFDEDNTFLETKKLSEIITKLNKISKN